jgi:threonine dehydratase
MHAVSNFPFCNVLILILFYAVAIKDVYEDMRVLLDLEGALAVAGCSKYLKEREMNDVTCVAVVSSGHKAGMTMIKCVMDRLSTLEKL